MDQTERSSSSTKIQKVNSSILAFRELINSLKLRNRGKQSQSQTNPQAHDDVSSLAFASELKQPPVQLQQNQSFSQNVSRVLKEDESLKLKIRGDVAGRDVLNFKPTLTSPQKINQQMASHKDHAESKNLQAYAIKQASKTRLGLRTSKNIEKGLSVNELPKQKNRQNKINKSVVQFAHPSSIAKQSNISAIDGPKFQQKKLNQTAVSCRNRIKNINEDIVMKYWKENYKLQIHSTANQISEFFQGLLNETNVKVFSPFIKKYKNCIYFGSPINEDDIYEGFLYYYESKIYYGEFLRGQKHGRGVEIILDEETIYKGIFEEGQKTGKFWVKGPEQFYIGFLEKGIYQGQGKLQTKQSVYEGQFAEGKRHGFGQEFFPKTGVKMTGYFQNGIFTKRSKSSFSHLQGQKNLQKGIKFRSPNSSAHKLGQAHRRPTHLSATAKQPRIDQLTQQLQIIEYSAQNSYQPRKALFDKQKVNGFMTNMNRQKFSEQMPQNIKDFDYSFDISSKNESQMLNFGSSRARFRNHDPASVQDFAYIQEQKQQVSIMEQPLPMPAFYRR